MADPIDFGSQLSRMQRLERDVADLKGAGGDGTFNGMEPRVAKLEAHMEHVRTELAKLADVPVDLAILKTKVEHLPGKGFIVSAAGTTIVMITGLLVLLQRLGVLH